MKIKDWIKKKVFILLLAGSLLTIGMVTSTGAILQEFEAAVEVLAEISIVEDVPLNFGRVRRGPPISGPTNYRIAAVDGFVRVPRWRHRA